MLALIRREFESVVVYWLIPWLITVIMVAILVWRMVLENSWGVLPVGIPKDFYSVFWFIFFFSPFICAGIGSMQMYSDRSKRISTFLATLATSRERIFGARILVGAGMFLVLFLVLGAAEAILLAVYPRLIPADTSFLVRMFVVTAILNGAAYAIGIWMGWSGGKWRAILGSVLFTAPLVGVVVIKGWGVQAGLLLAVVAGAALGRAWQRYMSASL